MSWSVSFIGTPAKITSALAKYSAESITGKSKEEFDAVLPHMTGVLAQNYSATGDPVMRLSASGHGHEGYNTCSLTIEFMNGALV